MRRKIRKATGEWGKMEQQSLLPEVRHEQGEIGALEDVSTAKRAKNDKVDTAFYGQASLESNPFSAAAPRPEPEPKRPKPPESYYPLKGDLIERIANCARVTGVLEAAKARG